jgi:S-adenosylmethionine decarboxylase
MRNLAPEITRQRLLIEGHYSIEIGQNEVEGYLLGVAAHLGLRTYGTPIVYAPGGQGKDENEGFDAFVPLIDSGISLYVWTGARFFATVLFTCKQFDTDLAVSYTLEYFDSKDAEHESF